MVSPLFRYFGMDQKASERHVSGKKWRADSDVLMSGSKGFIGGIALCAVLQRRKRNLIDLRNFGNHLSVLKSSRYWLEPEPLMKHLLLACLMLAAIIFPSMAALKEGDTAPDFTAEASRGGKSFDFSLAEALEKGPVVVFFFPAAFTDVCNVQAHEFAMNQEKFVAAGATVVGVSLDSISRLNEFSADPNYCGGKVAVASDAEGRIAKSYDLRVMDAPPGSKDSRGLPIEHGLVESLTFVIRPDGRIVATIGSRSPASNVTKALEAVQKLAAKQTAAKSPSL